MVQRVLAVLAFGVCALIASSARAVAQTTVSASYDPLVHELTENSSIGGHGEVARRLGSIAALAEIGVNHFDQATVMTVAPGVRYRFGPPASKVQPSVQGVAGLWHCAACEVNEFFVQPGVLVDYARSPALTLRFQFDVRRIFFDFGGETAERVGVGVVWTVK